MAVDSSKLKKPGRRSLGAPPTEGSPGFEGEFVPASDGGPQSGTFSTSIYSDRQAETDRADATRAPGPANGRPIKPMTQPEPSSAGSHQLTHGPTGTGEQNGARDRNGPNATAFAEHRPATGRWRGEQPNRQGRQRVPPPETEARAPFTTRISASTKERLEDACHYLRVKHQDFINQAIVAHLEKYGF